MNITKLDFNCLSLLFLLSLMLLPSPGSCDYIPWKSRENADKMTDERDLFAYTQLDMKRLAVECYDERMSLVYSDHVNGTIDKNSEILLRVDKNRVRHLHELRKMIELEKSFSQMEAKQKNKEFFPERDMVYARRAEANIFALNDNVVVIMLADYVTNYKELLDQLINGNEILFRYTVINNKTKRTVDAEFPLKGFDAVMRETFGDNYRTKCVKQFKTPAPGR